MMYFLIMMGKLPTYLIIIPLEMVGNLIRLMITITIIPTALSTVIVMMIHLLIILTMKCWASEMTSW